MPVDLSSLLADALTVQGYRVQDAGPVEGASGASYPVSLVAERDGERYLVDALASRPVRLRDQTALASIVEDTGFDGAIVLALEGVESTQASSKPRVEVWSRDRVDAAVGAHVLDQVLEGTLDPDEIGPTPEAVDERPKASPEDATPSQASQETPQQPPQDPSTNAGSQPPGPSQAAESGPPSDIQEETTDRSKPPSSTGTQPEPTPNAATADEGAAEGTGVNQREYVDPEDMLERAERLMEQGEVDDGDAELIVEDDEPSPSSSPEESAPAQQGADPSKTPASSSPEPQQPPRSAGQPSSGDAQVPEGDDSEPSEPDRPRPDAAPPEPETAATARGDIDADPDQEPQGVDVQEDKTTGVPSPAAAAGPATDEEAFLSGATIEPKVTQAEAQAKAEEVLFEIESTRLELLPFQVYRYDARLEGDGHTDREDGEVWVSTQSGAAVTAPDGDMIEEPEIPHERFQGSLTGEETEERAREHLLDALERREEVRQDYSESAVIERVRLAPDPEELVLEPRGKAFAPRWRVEGKNGTVFVDAVTAELVNG